MCKTPLPEWLLICGEVNTSSQFFNNCIASHQVQDWVQTCNLGPQDSHIFSFVIQTFADWIRSNQTTPFIQHEPVTPTDFHLLVHRQTCLQPCSSHRVRHGRVNTSYVYSIYSALQAMQEHFCWSIQYTHALCCGLYTVLGLVLNV